MLFYIISDALQHSFLKNLAHYRRGNFRIFPKGGRSSTTEVPALPSCGLFCVLHPIIDSLSLHSTEPRHIRESHACRDLSISQELAADHVHEKTVKPSYKILIQTSSKPYSYRIASCMAHTCNTHRHRHAKAHKLAS